MTFVSIFPSCLETRIAVARRLIECELMIGTHVCKRLAKPEGQDQPGHSVPYFVETKMDRGSQEIRGSEAGLSTAPEALSECLRLLSEKIGANRSPTRRPKSRLL